MLTEGVFSVDEITKNNIKKLAKRQSLIMEQRLCEISELAEEAADELAPLLVDGYSPDAIFSILGEALSLDMTDIHDGAMEENLSGLSSYLSTVGIYDRTAFVSLLYNGLKKRRISLYESDFLPVEDGEETFTYVKNPLADEAYDVFSESFSDPRVKYSRDFNEAVKLVKSGECRFCLLPLEEKGGARIPSMISLIYREELKIDSVTPVFGFDGVADMKYALVSKGYIVPKIDDGDDRYLELSLPKEVDLSLGDLFLAASILGATVYRVNTLSVEGEYGSNSQYSVVLRADRGDFTKLLIFLSLFLPSYIAVGIYKNLE